MNSLPIRDVHLPPAPAAWPPGPLAWLLIALAVVALVGILWWFSRVIRRVIRRRRWLAAFDQAVAEGETGPGRLAAASKMLRRLALAVDPQAAVSREDAWLRWLDGRDQSRPFSSGAGRLFELGPFRAEVDDAAAEEALQVARRRLAQAA